MSTFGTDDGHGSEPITRCAATTHQGGQPCKMRAGWGTNHVGIGRCKLHGGATPDHVKHANGVKAAEAVATFGLPREVAPDVALLEEVHRTAGHVAYLAQVVAELERTELKQLDASEKFEKPAVWVEMYQAERKHLVRVCATAIGAGIAERQVRLAEDQGRQLASVLRDVLGDTFAALAEAASEPAGLTVDVLVRIQRDAVPAVVQRRLSEVMALGVGA